MKASIKLFISTTEIKAHSKFQDNMTESVNIIREALGNKPIETPSMWKKIKVMLGGDLVVKGEYDSKGALSSYEMRINKNGIEINADCSVEEYITKEVMAMYTDVVNAYLPVATSTISGMIAANALARKREDLAAKKMGIL